MRARKLSAPTGRPVHVIEPARHARAYRPDKGYSVTDPLVAKRTTGGKAASSQARLKRSQRGKP